MICSVFIDILMVHLHVAGNACSVLTKVRGSFIQGVQCPHYKEVSLFQEHYVIVYSQELFTK